MGIMMLYRRSRVITFARENDDEKNSYTKKNAKTNKDRHPEASRHHQKHHTRTSKVQAEPQQNSSYIVSNKIQKAYKTQAKTKNQREKPSIHSITRREGGSTHTREIH